MPSAPGRSGAATLGILGGMGPLASAEFIRTIYEFNLATVEQSMPRVLLDSDPGLPDRTEAINDGRESEIVGLLNTRIAGLSEAGATRIVVACVTAHHFLDGIDPALRARVVSLVAVTVRALTASPGRFLLLASQGTRTARLFERAPGWDRVAGRVVLPGQADQALVQRLINQAKQLEAAPGDVPGAVQRLRARYGCSGVILGCTEFHLYSRDLVARCGADRVVDALCCIAADLGSYLGGRPDSQLAALAAVRRSADGPAWAGGKPPGEDGWWPHSA